MTPVAPDRLAALLTDLRDFVEARNWKQFHDPKNLSMLAASEAGELLALFRWVNNQDADEYAMREPNHARIAAEVADVGIALLLLCDRLGLDFVEAVKAKIEVNRRNYPADRVRGRAEREE